MNVAPAVDPTGKVIRVEMATDGKGNYFAPKSSTPRVGTWSASFSTGVHTVSFPDDSNSTASGLPKSSNFLQLPGQESDLAVTLQPGSYYFHCDPHAALGMKGTLSRSTRERMSAGSASVTPPLCAR